MISIIIPTKNEAANIEKLFKRLSKIKKKIRRINKIKYEIIIVDSQSKDKTKALVEKFRRR